MPSFLTSTVGSAFFTWVVGLCPIVLAGVFVVVPAPPRVRFIEPKLRMVYAIEEPPNDKKDVMAVGGTPKSARYDVTFLNLHTREVLPVVRAELPSLAMSEEVRRFLRCRATGQETMMALRPLQVAADMAFRFEQKRVEVVSAFRSPKFNEALRKKGRGVASRSHHVRGEALDFRIPGVTAADLAAAVEEVHEGGIGTYRESNFVHVDVGRDRRWTGR
ncbi:MAG: DUF882 domain-containing protein [Myxococcota bacterium]